MLLIILGFSHDGILVAIAVLNARLVSLFAHQGSHDNVRLVIVADRAFCSIAVKQLAAARHLARKGSHTVDVFRIRIDRKHRVHDAEALDGTDDVVEET